VGLGTGGIGWVASRRLGGLERRGGVAGGEEQRAAAAVQCLGRNVIKERLGG
jgi:hypothetical protein